MVIVHRPNGRPRSFRVSVPIESMYVSSLIGSVATLVISCTVSEIYRGLKAEIRPALSQLSFNALTRSELNPVEFRGVLDLTKN